MTKRQCENNIIKAIETAKANGFGVVVASDPEGNSWNELNPENMLFGDTKPNTIALGVWANADENDIFTE